MDFDVALNGFPVRDAAGNVLFVVNLDGSLSFPHTSPTAKVRFNKTSNTLEAYDGANWHALERGLSGQGVAVAAAATTMTVNVNEADANYTVGAAPHWSTAWYVSAQSAASFTVTFATAAPTGGSTADWSISR